MLSRFAANFEHPTAHEGHHRILYLKPEDTRLQYARADVAAILQRVCDSPAVDSSGIPHIPRQGDPTLLAPRNQNYRGRKGLNSASQRAAHNSSNLRRGRGPNAWGTRWSRGASTAETSGTSPEIGIRRSG